MYLVTGAAGFIGYHVCKRLLEEGEVVVGIDNLNDYYSVDLKVARLNNLKDCAKFSFHKIDISDRQAVEKLFGEYKFNRVIHLAAQAGVRYSIENPYAYADSNLMGMLTILEGCRNHKIEHLVYASSSSVYGMNDKVPFSEHDKVDNPVSFYAATKKANEVMAESYANLYKIKCTGLRFFTVYGPWGRPDMAPMLFADAIINKREIKLFNRGDMLRDFTYIDDIVDGILRVGLSNSSYLHELFNIGNSSPVKLIEFIDALESSFELNASKTLLPMQKGDVVRTFADIDKLQKLTGYKPKVDIREGVSRFVDWYKYVYLKTVQKHDKK